MNEKGATHRCIYCGARWRFNPPSKAHPEGSWSLVSAKSGKCCDNESMKHQIVPLSPGTP